MFFGLTIPLTGVHPWTKRGQHFTYYLPAPNLSKIRQWCYYYSQTTAVHIDMK